MHSISHFWHLSRNIYNCRNFREKKRAVVFFTRAICNRDKFEELYRFFDAYDPMKGFLEIQDPDFQEVLTRVFLFKNSNMRQRLDAVKHHFEICAPSFQMTSFTVSTGAKLCHYGNQTSQTFHWKLVSVSIRDNGKKDFCLSTYIMKTP